MLPGLREDTLAGIFEMLLFPFHFFVIPFFGIKWDAAYPYSDLNITHIILSRLGSRSISQRVGPFFPNGNSLVDLNPSLSYKSLFLLVVASR